MGARLIWAGENYRIVKRDTSRWREGVFDIEHRSTDALGHDSWSQVECVSYDNKDGKHAALVEIIRFTLDK